MNQVLVVGSAHLDVLSRARDRDDVLDRVGDMSIEVGGTGCNIAINLLEAGVSVRFLTALNRSAISAVVAESLTALGLDLHVEYDDGLPVAGFSAHIDTGGEMVSAVSSMPVERVNFDAGRVAELMCGAKAVVLDCNLSPVALDRLVRVANERKVPAYIAAVSEEKSLRIANVSGRIAGVFLNWAEYRFFCRRILGGGLAPVDAARAIPAMLMVTEGAVGSTLALPDGSSHHIAPAEVEAGGTRLGMGDALAAGVILFHECHGLPLPEAATRAMEMVGRVGRTPHCNVGGCGALEATIGRFRHQAGHDAMTGVLNRRSTEQALGKAFERRAAGAAGALAVLMLDIDHFKSVNDTYGHNTGDDVIVAVTRAVQECLRVGAGDFLGRWGGEEFLVVLPGTGKVDALKVGERIRATVERRVTSPRQVTISVGCSETDAAATGDLRTLIARADGALYEAKHGGRNRVAFAALSAGKRPTAAADTHTAPA